MVARQAWSKLFVEGSLLQVGGRPLEKLERRGKRKGNPRDVFLTDRGHIENLGIYELLRRRCETIIAVDGDADPDMNVLLLGATAKVREDRSWDDNQHGMATGCRANTSGLTKDRIGKKERRGRSPCCARAHRLSGATRGIPSERWHHQREWRCHAKADPSNPKRQRRRPVVVPRALLLAVY
jgi:hypothetical protein